MSPPRRKSSEVPTEEFPAIGVPSRTRSIVYVAERAGVFAILLLVFYYVLLPQNQQSIDNQKALQTSIAKIIDTNASWAAIMEKQVANEARFTPTLEALTVEIRGLRNEVRELRGK